MTNLLAAALCFLVLHRAVSGSQLRGRIIARLGEGRFRAGFAMASVLGVLWLGLAYAVTSPEWRLALWPVPSWVAGLSIALQPVALLLILSGLLAPNPTAVGQERLAHRSEVVRGALRVTRHPFLWGVVLLAAGHMTAVPSPRALVLFGTLLAVALAGTLSIDAKLRHRLGERWKAYASATSNLPFAAILQGRQPLRPGELGWRNALAAAVLTAGTALAHPAFW